MVAQIHVDKTRIETLSDSLFAIVMTFLMMQVKLPNPGDGDIMTNAEIWSQIAVQLPLFLAYVLTFAIMANMWFSHHALITLFAKNINRKLALLNIAFLFVISILPFSTQLLGRYSYSELAVTIYCTHMLLLTVLLWWMKEYVLRSKFIENPDMTPENLRYNTLRIVLSSLSTLLGIGISFWSTYAALIVSVVPIFYLLIP